MHRLPEALLDAALVLREAFAGQVGDPCQLTVSSGDGTMLCVYPDGDILAVYAAGGSKILRHGRAVRNSAPALAR